MEFISYILKTDRDKERIIFIGLYCGTFSIDQAVCSIIVDSNIEKVQEEYRIIKAFKVNVTIIKYMFIERCIGPECLLCLLLTLSSENHT